MTYYVHINFRDGGHEWFEFSQRPKVKRKRDVYEIFGITKNGRTLNITLERDFVRSVREERHA